ncbi:P-loop containing nucleoside triphosphate hydrolase protein [Coprinellus micaceus]|uniref:P-loop containing nucleoside triphosphate hydrolase protein n=1 Tax=Coprinellus micaceus TaxID=71717 RepID=A0A4Y7STH1_COPMI|nr:P-loop containing nucleoside triphosphate hydrolase protein [Coprinellus micaceus]
MSTSTLSRRRKPNPAATNGDDEGKGQYDRPPSSNVLPLDSTSLSSQFTYSWLTPIMARSAAFLSSKLESAWDQDKAQSLVHATNEVVGSFFWIGGACKVFADVSQMIGPLLIKVPLSFSLQRNGATDNPPPLAHGLLLATSLFGLATLTSLVHHQFFWRSITAGVLARTALISSMYSRSVRSMLSNVSLIHDISTDVSRVEAAARWFHPVWSAPIQVSICLSILLFHLGLSALSGFALFILVFPLQRRILGRQFQIRKRIVKLTELRTRSLLEALRFMHFIKCYTLEMPFLRTEELSGIRAVQNVQSANAALASSLPVLSATLSFISYSRSGDFDLAVMFASLSFVSALATAHIVLAKGSFADHGCLGLIATPILHLRSALLVKSATFEWEPVDESASPVFNDEQQGRETARAPFALSVVDLEVSRGSLVAVIGSVASGKSSLLQGLVGAMRRTSGEVSFCGRVGYCQQDAWIQRGSIVLRDVCLEEDLSDFPEGDQTQVGEDGLTLSGGQRRRIGLARALYFDGDILFLDDPLSSVDPRVGNHIFQNAVLDARAAGKAILMVIYDRTLLSQCDRVLCMKGGTLVEEGCPSDADQSYVLVEPEAALLGKRTVREETVSRKEVHESGPINSATWTTRKGEHGEVYRTYLRVARGFLSVPTLAFATLVMQTFQILGSRSLVWWQSDAFHRSFGFYQAMYAMFGLLQASATFCLSTVVDSISSSVSRNIHDEALKNIVHAPMSFFQATSRGAVVNLFGKDMDSVDNQLPSSTRTLCLTVATVLSSVAVIVYFQPYLSIVAALACIGYYHFYQMCRTTSKQLKRIEANLRTSLYSHITESLNGLQTLRIYGRVDHSVAETNRLLDLQNSASFLVATSERWLSVRLDLCGAVLVFSVRFLHAIWGVSHTRRLSQVALCAVLGVGNINPAQIGLILTYTTTLTQMAGLLTRQLADVELQMNSVERLGHYLDPVGQETPSTTKDPPAEWPQCGAVSLKNVSVKYRAGSPDALQSVCLKIRPGEKLGIVGRTGAGKSSLVNCLMRIVEYSGCIEIDGIDISTVPLKALRSKLSFVPQQSVVFGGTVRSAIDPDDQFNDGTLRGGANLSLGERALLSLARVLVRDSKIVVLDEATASIDSETDEGVQRGIHHEFRDRTLICISHRIRSVLAYDRIAVLDGGVIVELDTPLNLFDRGGLFKEICVGGHIMRKDVVGAKWGY